MKKTFLTVSFLSCALILLSLTLAIHKVSAQKGRGTPSSVDEDRFVPGRVLVKFRANVGLDHARQIVAALNAREADLIPQIGLFVLDLPEQADEVVFANAFRHRPEVEFAELDR